MGGDINPIQWALGSHGRFWSRGWPGSGLETKNTPQVEAHVVSWSSSKLQTPNSLPQDSKPCHSTGCRLVGLSSARWDGPLGVLHGPACLSTLSGERQMGGEVPFSAGPPTPVWNSTIHPLPYARPPLIPCLQLCRWLLGWGGLCAEGPGICPLDMEEAGGDRGHGMKVARLECMASLGKLPCGEASSFEASPLPKALLDSLQHAEHQSSQST